MNEFVYAEFLFTNEEDVKTGNQELAKLGDDFVRADFTMDIESGQVIVFGKIRSVAATSISLSESFLGKRMQVSYISDALKDKYRR